MIFHSKQANKQNRFEKPSAIQQRAIIPFIKGGDLIAQAQSGTGKTGAFTIGLLQRMDWSLRSCQGLVLSPTRELAVQTEQVISQIGEYLCDGTFCHTFVGMFLVFAVCAYRSRSLRLCFCFRRAMQIGNDGHQTISKQVEPEFRRI